MNVPMRKRICLNQLSRYSSQHAPAYNSTETTLSLLLIILKYIESMVFMLMSPYHYATVFHQYYSHTFLN